MGHNLNTHNKLDHHQVLKMTNTLKWLKCPVVFGVLRNAGTSIRGGVMTKARLF